MPKSIMYKLPDSLLLNMGDILSVLTVNPAFKAMAPVMSYIFFSTDLYLILLNKDTTGANAIPRINQLAIDRPSNRMKWSNIGFMGKFLMASYTSDNGEAIFVDTVNKINDILIEVGIDQAMCDLFKLHNSVYNPQICIGTMYLPAMSQECLNNMKKNGLVPKTDGNGKISFDFVSYEPL